jgi:HEAT repeat protein
MPSFRFPARLALAAIVGVLSGRASAAPQIPPTKDPPPAKGGNVAPHLVCTICGSRNYNIKDDGRRDPQGLPIAWCSNCKRDTPQRPTTTAGGGSEGIPSTTKPKSKVTGKGGRLVLPPTNPADSEGGAETPAPMRPLEPTGKMSPRERAAAENLSPAAFVLAEVRRQKKVDENLTRRAVESLLSLGEDGLAASRDGLASEDAPVLLVSARVLLRSPHTEDADLVFRRLRSPLPSAAGTPLVELAVHADPVRATPAFLAELLEHPHAGVRTVAQKHLAALPPAERLAVLNVPLASKRSDARCRAVELASGVDGPEATEVLLERLSDPSSNVVGAVVDALAPRESPDLDAKLVGLAFRDRWVLRPNACALVAIVEREDWLLRPILDETRVEPLLAGLKASDPFISGACAAALSGIGFRSRDTAGTAWLDQDVLDRLVSSVSGRVFHSDLPVLSAPALRRLELLSGQGIGADGPSWVEWWLHAREGFVARRAWLEIRPEDVPRLGVRYVQGGTEPRDFRLVGPEAGDAFDRAPGAPEPELLRLTDGQVRALSLALEREGVYGPTRLPGLRGLRGASERTFEVSIGLHGSAGARGKVFVYGPGEHEDWFERTAALALDLRERSRWQLYPDPARHATSLDLWKEQSAWWAEDHTDLERAIRMKGLVLAALPAATGPKQLAAIGELEQAYRAGAADPKDFEPLHRALAAETYWAEPARRLLGLALESAGAAPLVPEVAAKPTDDGSPGTPKSPDAKADAPTASPASPAKVDAAATAGASAGAGVPKKSELREEPARMLVDLLVEKLSGAPREELAHVFASSGSAFAISMAGDPRPTVRAAAATAIAESELRATKAGEDAASPPQPSPEATSALMRLLGDRDTTVEAAAAEALGDLKVESARTELIVRARLGITDVRIAALKAIGRLKGELVLDALALAAADKDPRVRAAAASGIADLGDKSGAQLLVGMLGEGDDAPMTEPARRGLLAMGTAAREDLLRVAQSPTHRARRDATLILARECAPEAASPMMAMLSSEPKDEHVASELAVLTGVDLRAEPDPPGAWWSWWDGVVHDDATAWFLSALARAGASPPPEDAFKDQGTADARQFLVEVLGRKEPHFVERARRELGRMLGRDLGTMPPKGLERDRWIETVRKSIAAPAPK